MHHQLEKHTNIFESLRSKNDLDSLNYTTQVFIVDKQKNQRGRIDDRDEDEIKNDSKRIGLYSYNSILVLKLIKKWMMILEFYLQSTDKKEREILIQISED